MARKVAQSDPALAIEFWLSGFYTHRSQLFAPFKGIGINVVSFHDPVLDGANMEDTDLFEWQRRPGFSIFCPTPLTDSEIVNQFYGMRNLDGEVISFFDSTMRLASFTNTGIISVIPKTTTEEGFISTVGNMVYFSDGAAVDMQKWDSVTPFSSINPSAWGIPAPTLTPSIFSRGCWLPFTGFVVNNAILDPNGSVEVVTSTFGGSGISGANEPMWPTTIASTINDGSIQWTNMGPLLAWLPAQFYPVPVVVLDTNGNLELATATTPAVTAWDAGTTYAVGVVVSFGGLYWAALVANTGVTPTSNYTVTTTTGSTSVTQPYWVQTANPSTTGTYSSTPFTPTWNTTVGGTTVDGNYTWTNLGPGVLVESFGTSYVYCYRTIYGHLSTASPVSLNTGSIFGPQVATITSFSISANIVTFHGVNNFIPGNVFSVQGLTVGTYLNNESFIVQAAGLSPTEFSASFDFPNVPSTLDSGSTLNLIASVTGVGSASPLCNATASITATQVVAGVVTIYAVNDFVPGLQVTFTGLTVATFLNDIQFQIINVDPAGLWFQVYYTNSLGIVPPNQAITTDTGTATFNSIEIYRTSDGGGIYLFTGAVTNPAESTSVQYDSGLQGTGHGADDGTPGIYPWVNPNNVTSSSAFATVSVPPPTMMASARFSLVQTCKNFVNRHAAGLPAGGTLPASFGSPVTVGNAILVFVTLHNDNSPSQFSISDTQGNIYTQIAANLVQLSNGAWVGNWVYLATGIAGGTTTVNMNYGPNTAGNTFLGFSASECSGLAGTAETPATAHQNLGTSLNSGAVTTGVANTLLVSFIWSDLGLNSANVATPPGGFSSFSSQVAFEPSSSGSTNFANHFLQMAAIYQVQTTVGTFSPTWSTPANLSGLGITIALPLFVYETSNGLNANEFNFSVPTGIGISGIEVDFNASFNGTAPDGILEVQLLQGGVPVGAVMRLSLRVAPAGTSYTLGGAGNLWGTTWTPSDFNSAAWGVRFIATQAFGGTTATFGINHVQARVLGGTNTGWVFNDFTTDANLNVLQVAPQNHLNDPPPGAPGSSVNQIVGTLTTYWQGRLWMAVGNYVYFDAGPDCVNGVPEESWPPANRFQFAGPVFNIVPTADGVGLLIYLADRVAAILGGPETISFYATDALSNFGISNPNAIFRDGSIIGQFTTQRQYFELVDKTKQEIGEHIADYLTDNFDPATSFVTMHRDGLDVGVFISNGVDQVLRYGSNIGAWSVPSFPLSGAGALRSIETSVGVYSLMLASPTGGVSGSSPQAAPQLGISAGSGVAWDNPNNLTLNDPTQYATVSLAISDSSQTLQASNYPLNIPGNAVITGIQVAVTGKEIQPSLGSVAINNQATMTSWMPGDPNLVINMEVTGNPVNAGDVAFILVIIEPTNAMGASTGVISITDSLGNTWNQLGATQSIVFLPPLQAFIQQIFYAVMGTAIAPLGTLTITGVLDAPSQIVSIPDPPGFISVVGIGGIPSSVLQNSGTAPNQSTGPITVGGPSLLLSFIGEFGQFTSVPSGWTDTQIDHLTRSPVFWGAAYIQENAAGSYNDQWTVTAPDAGTTVTTLAAFPVGSTSEVAFTITPLNAGSGAESDSGQFNITNTTVTFGGPTDLWGMPSWSSPAVVNADAFGFGINIANAAGIVNFFVSEVQVTVFYQAPGNYLYARDITTWADGGQIGQNNGTPYPTCFITVGSITLSQPGAPMFPLQHVVGYFDAVGTLNDGAPSQPDIWILPNEISDTAGVGFVQLPEVIQEPPTGQNHPSLSLLALRWPLNMMNSYLASQFMHHLQVKIQFEPENAPNTIKSLAFKENQD